MKVKALQFGKALNAALFVLLLNVVGLTNALAQNYTFTVGYLNYSLNDDWQSVTVVGHVDGIYSMDTLAIPESVNLEGWDYPVTAIGNNAFSYCYNSGGTLTIPNLVTNIGERAFYGCWFDGVLEIPDNVITIGNEAFANIFGFYEINTGNGVEWIGDKAFQNTYFWELTIGENVTHVGEKAFEGCGVETVHFNAINCSTMSTCEQGSPVSDCHSVFASGNEGEIPSISTLIIGENVQYIPDYAFKDCTNIVYLTIPNSVTEIGTAAFYGCWFNTLHLGSSLNNMGSYAFYGCSGLASITLFGDTPPTVQDNAFDEVDRSIPLYVPQGKVGIYESAPVWSEFTNIQEDNNIHFVDNKVKEICLNWDDDGDGELSFVEAAAVNSLSFDGEDNVFKGSEIEYFDEFQYFTGLTSVDNEEFSYCGGLVSIIIPNTVTSINSYAFDGCSSLVSVTIPNSVTSIGSCAFRSCISLVTVDIPNSVRSIISGAFDACSGLVSLTIPSSVVSLGDGNTFYGCSGLEQIIVDTENPNFDSRDNCNAIIVSNSNVLYAGCKNTVIPNTVTEIGTLAFGGCSGLTSIVIPNSVTTIGTQTFQNTGLTSIDIPNSVTLIGTLTFSGCNITTVTIPSSVTKIGNNPFSYTSSIESIVVDPANCNYDSRGNCNAIINTSTNKLVSGCKNTVIPNTVTSIGAYAFSDCSDLTSITIPQTVTSIEYQAFIGCSGLTSITIFSETPPETPTTVESYTFGGVPKDIPVYVPYGSSSAYRNAFVWRQFTNYQELPPSSITQTNEFDAGWNLWSTNMDIDLAQLKDAIVNAVGTDGTATIKSQNGAIKYENGRWRPADMPFDISKMYKIHVSAACEITLTGIPANPADYEITISNGSNWIGFPCSESMSVGTALSGLNPEDGDIIKSMNGSSSFKGTTWRGSLQTLEPGHGYIYQSKASGDKTFTFPANAK